MYRTRQKSFIFKATKKIGTCAPHWQTFCPTLKQGVNDVERLLLYYLLKIIHEILLILLENEFHSL